MLKSFHCKSLVVGITNTQLPTWIPNNLRKVSCGRNKLIGCEVEIDDFVIPGAHNSRSIGCGFCRVPQGIEIFAILPILMMHHYIQLSEILWEKCWDCIDEFNSGIPFSYFILLTLAQSWATAERVAFNVNGWQPSFARKLLWLVRTWFSKTVNLEGWERSWNKYCLKWNLLRRQKILLLCGLLYA